MKRNLSCCYELKTFNYIFTKTFNIIMTIRGFDNYSIDENANITNLRTGRVLKTSFNHKGYCQISLSKNGFSKTKTIHRIMWNSFMGEIPDNMEINHIDGVKTNNKISNLEIVSKKENMIKAVEIGLIKSGENCDKSKKVKQINVINGEIVAIFGSIRIAAKKTGIAGSSISQVINGKIRKTAGGFKWESI